MIAPRQPGRCGHCGVPLVPEPGEPARSVEMRLFCRPASKCGRERAKVMRESRLLKRPPPQAAPAPQTISFQDDARAAKNPTSPGRLWGAEPFGFSLSGSSLGDRFIGGNRGSQRSHHKKDG